MLIWPSRLVSVGWLGLPRDENMTIESGFVEAATQATHGLTHWGAERVVLVTRVSGREDREDAGVIGGS